MSITRQPGSLSRTDRRGGVVAGCLVVLAILLILVIVGGAFVAMNWRTWAADFGMQGVEAVLDKSELPDEQRSAIMTEAQDLADRFEAGDVSLDQMRHVFEELGKSPIIPVAAVYGARKQYIEPSGLSEEEKAEADLQMQRLARGVFEKKVSIDELEDAVDQIAVRTSENQWRLREPEVVDDDDLREMIGKIDALADEKEIPAEPFEVDIAREVEEAIDRGLGEAPALEAGAPEGGENGSPEGEVPDAPAGDGSGAENDGQGDSEPGGGGG